MRCANPAPAARALPSVTLLKPLHSDEPQLAENLESFFVQDYPAPVQIVFGVQNEADPAIATVRALKAKHPYLDMDLVIDARLFGANRKISNLINMFPAPRHDVLILSDSDIAVPRSWLKTVIGTLQQPGVGAVTCLYIGKPLGSLWSRLAAMGHLLSVPAQCGGGNASQPGRPLFRLHHRLHAPNAGGDRRLPRPSPVSSPMIMKSAARCATRAIASRCRPSWSITSVRKKVSAN